MVGDKMARGIPDGWSDAKATMAGLDDPRSGLVSAEAKRYAPKAYGPLKSGQLVTRDPAAVRAGQEAAKRRAANEVAGAKAGLLGLLDVPLCTPDGSPSRVQVERLRTQLDDLSAALARWADLHTPCGCVERNASLRSDEAAYACSKCPPDESLAPDVGKGAIEMSEPDEKRGPPHCACAAKHKCVAHFAADAYGRAPGRAAEWARGPGCRGGDDDEDEPAEDAEARGSK